MNDVQKKSLIITLLLAINYYLIVTLTALFVFLLPLLVIQLVVSLVILLKIKRTKEEILDKAKFLILPLLFNLGGAFFLISLFQPVARIIFATFFIALNFYLLIAIKKVQNLEERAAIFQRNLLVSISFLTVLLTLAAVFRNYVLLSTVGSISTLPVIMVVILTASIFYFISYFLSWEYGVNLKKFRSYNLVSALLASEISLISAVWVMNYPVFSNVERANLGGIPFPAVYLTIVFYFIWGIISHKMDKSLTRKVMTEYIILTIIFLLVLTFTAKWLPIS